MASLEELRNERIKKLRTLTETGISAYPIETRRDAVVKQVVDDAVAEVCGPHFARLGAGNDETNAPAGSI